MRVAQCRLPSNECRVANHERHCPLSIVDCRLPSGSERTARQKIDNRKSTIGNVFHSAFGIRHSALLALALLLLAVLPARADILKLNIDDTIHPITVEY